tara:strand:- start:164 stop:280 length:117 start_codon:yes stop_codon:yes gene_type:complete
LHGVITWGLFLIEEIMLKKSINNKVFNVFQKNQNIEVN